MAALNAFKAGLSIEDVQQKGQGTKAEMYAAEDHIIYWKNTDTTAPDDFGDWYKLNGSWIKEQVGLSEPEVDARIEVVVKTKQFKTFAELKAADLSGWDRVATAYHHDKSIGGGSAYVPTGVSGGTPNTGDEWAFYDGSGVQYAIEIDGVIDPRKFGCKCNFTTDDSAAWSVLLSGLPVEEEHTVLITGISRVDNTRIIIPREGNGGRNMNIKAHGMVRSGFKFVGSGSGLAIGNYSGDETTPGQLTGAVQGGGTHGDLWITASSDVEYPLWVGYVGHIKMDNVFVFGGQEQMYLSETQDGIFNTIILSGHASVTQTNLVLNHGANGNRFSDSYALNAVLNPIHIRSDDTTGSGAVKLNGPGQNKFKSFILDKSPLVNAFVLIESGVGNELIDCRVNCTRTSGDPIPLIKTIAPTGTANAQTGTKITGGSLRCTEASSDYTYLVDQAASSGSPVQIINVTAMNIGESPMYVSAVGDVVDNNILYVDCAAIGSSDDVDRVLQASSVFDEASDRALNSAGLLNMFLSLADYADDTAAAAAGVDIGEPYRTGSTLKVRVA